MEGGREGSSHVCQQHRNSTTYTTNSWVDRRTDGWRPGVGARTILRFLPPLLFFYLPCPTSPPVPLFRKSNQVIPTLKPCSFPFPSRCSRRRPPSCLSTRLSFLLPLPEGFWTDGRTMSSAKLLLAESSYPFFLLLLSYIRDSVRIIHGGRRGREVILKVATDVTPKTDGKEFFFFSPHVLGQGVARRSFRCVSREVPFKTDLEYIPVHTPHQSLYSPLLPLCSILQ